MIVFRDDKGWVLILQPENLARMEQGDPVTIPDLGIMICFESLSPDKLMQACAVNPRKYLTRGWQEHPDDFGPAVKIGEVKVENEPTELELDSILLRKPNGGLE